MTGTKPLQVQNVDASPAGIIAQHWHGLRCRQRLGDRRRAFKFRLRLRMDCRFDVGIKRHPNHSAGAMHVGYRMRKSAYLGQNPGREPFEAHLTTNFSRDAMVGAARCLVPGFGGLDLT